MDEYANHVRRKDRQKPDPSFLHDLLSNAMSCSIAIEKDGFPFIHVAFFVFDEKENEITFHFSKHGYAGEQITDGKKAAISVYKYGKLYTAEKAVDFGCEYQSVIVYGKISILTDEAERMRAMQKFFGKFFGNVTEKYEELYTSSGKTHPRCKNENCRLVWQGTPLTRLRKRFVLFSGKSGYLRQGFSTRAISCKVRGRTFFANPAPHPLALSKNYLEFNNFNIVC